jgi:hypothetical protein
MLRNAERQHQIHRGALTLGAVKSQCPPHGVDKHEIEGRVIGDKDNRGRDPRELAPQGFVKERAKNLQGETFGIQVFGMDVRIRGLFLKHVQHSFHDAVCPAEALVVGVDDQDTLGWFGSVGGMRNDGRGEEGKDKYDGSIVRHVPSLRVCIQFIYISE